MKSFAKPPTAVISVTGAVMILLANKTKKIPKDRSWNAAKVMMSKVRLQILRSYPYGLSVLDLQLLL